MTDNQDSKIKVGVQTPPTDRPLTAGDWIEHDGGPMPAISGRAEVKLRSGDCFTGSDLTDENTWLHIWGEGDIIAYRLSRPATSAASEGEGVGDSSGRIDAKRLVSRLRELEALHESRMQEPLVSYAQGLESGMADAMGSVADWIEAGDFDAALASPPVSERERELEGALRGMCEAYRLVCDDAGKPYYQSASSRYAHAMHLITAQPAGEGK